MSHVVAMEPDSLVAGGAAITSLFLSSKLRVCVWCTVYTSASFPWEALNSLYTALRSNTAFSSMDSFCTRTPGMCTSVMVSVSDSVSTTGAASCSSSSSSMTWSSFFISRSSSPSPPSSISGDA